MDIARAWATEFYRLKGKIFFDNNEVKKEILEFNKNLEEKTQQFNDEMANYNDKNYISNYDTSDRNEGKNNSSKANKISINVENIDTNKNESETMSDNEDKEEILLNISFIYDVEKGKKYNLVNSVEVGITGKKKLN